MSQIVEQAKKVDVLDYFDEKNNIFEKSQLISLAYYPERQIFEMVISYAMTPSFVYWLQGGEKPDKLSPADFRRLIFKEVFNFQVKDRLIKDNADRIRFAEPADKNLFLLFYDVELRENLWANFEFASDTKFEFNFEELWVEERFGRPITNENGEVREYQDINIGEKFNRYNPFELT